MPRTRNLDKVASSTAHDNDKSSSHCVRGGGEEGNKTNSRPLENIAKLPKIRYIFTWLRRIGLHFRCRHREVLLLLVTWALSLLKPKLKKSVQRHARARPGKPRCFGWIVCVSWERSLSATRFPRGGRGKISESNQYLLKWNHSTRGNGSARARKEPNALMLKVIERRQTPTGIFPNSAHMLCSRPNALS